MIININNEKELHYKVVDYIRHFIKEAVIIPGLGEHQINSGVRTDAYLKGYSSGQPDILLLNYHTHYKGLAIELKTPTGTGIISKNQGNYINVLENNGFKVLISNNYDEIITTILMYSLGIRYLIKNTKRKFRTIASRDKYLKLHNKNVFKEIFIIYYNVINRCSY